MEPIPGPKGLPLIGNLLDLRDEEGALRALERLADMYGPVFQVTLRGTPRIFVSGAKVMTELVDERQFVKLPPPALAGGGGAKGLFAAASSDPDWAQAHTILVPAFGPLKIEDMFDGMKDVATQLVLKWARKDSTSPILLTDDLTRLTLDTIALCAMDYRFNSFYQESMHPFVDAMLNVLHHAGAASSRPSFISMFMPGTEAEAKKNSQYMDQVAQEIIDRRRQHPVEKKDLLNSLIHGTDPKSGQRMRDELVRANMITFLVAGHETTSGLLSFLFLYLLQNPSTLVKAQDEVDSVIGTSEIQIGHLSKLRYLAAALRETLRLSPTAPAISKMIAPGRESEVVTLCDGKYRVEPNQAVNVLLAKCQSDPTIFGDDAKDFRPERMLEDQPDFEELQKYWRPFGNGSRACIGRPFAWQEALLITAMVLQNFDLSLADPSYQMRIKQTLTIKPTNLYIKATLRRDLGPIDLDRRLHGSVAESKPQTARVKDATAPAIVDETSIAEPLTILYGSNTGTCQSLAQKLASQATSSHGVEPVVQDLDTGMRKLPKDSPVVIITASYEGQPPDNAAQFVEWLGGLTGRELEGVKYAVFGCGHSDWHATLHRMPKLIDQEMHDRGAERLVDMGLSDVSRGNIVGDFETWMDETFWPAYQKMSHSDHASAEQNPTVEAELSTGTRASTLRHDVQVGVVKQVDVLTTPGEPVKRHMEIQLPSDASYDCGDYLAILPQNPEQVVRRVMSHFQLPWDAVITLKSKSFAPLPLNTPLSVYDVLRSYVELSQPATKKGLKICASCTEDGRVRSFLSELIDNTTKFELDVVQSRTSIFDVLRKETAISMLFPTFLSLMMPLSVRQYSISSSPWHDPHSCTITYGVLDQEARSNLSKTPFVGVATNYLSTLESGDSIQVAVHPTAKKTFRLPLDVQKTPLLMFCAGTGLAPFRGFVQQRAVQLETNPETTLAPAVLFVGCRSPTRDRLYSVQMDTWAKLGAVDIRYSFSAESEKSVGCKHVSDRMLKDREVIVKLWREGARVYVCGSRSFATDVRDAAQKIVELQSASHVVDRSNEQGPKTDFWEAVRERAASDIFD